ncbi:hypothetical protein BZA05DRAFT_441045 [Tricharina praecox]|uniref:uncharacterized protein n=1 Tax=Tricharina praecox TaxID=43433 RepID=UPI00221FFC03|nr:uncharacterized protein BZA05DRAFT_441045 [Tricharina praecox]KAI5857738.1 hypothetical protein BZA05DRAFT_441045 [Tricharina praecox]
MTGFYTFKWDHPANEVYVTGTFDGWSRSTKLDKAGEVFVKKVELPVENILYKFVVDGNWVTDPNAPLETEESGVQNNILLSTVIAETEEEKAMEAAIINSAAPESTTAVLAAVVPKETETVVITSIAPESTTASLAGGVPLEQPTPGAGDVPGGFPETPASEIVDPTPVALKEVEQIFSVKPLPASETAENPITLQPGEAVPQIGTESIDSHVTLDKESYEKGATNFPIGSWVLPDVVTPAEQRAAEGRGVLDLPRNLIPESSLPITSAAEAAEVKEADVPEIVKESQEKAHAPAEASAIADAVELKAAVESELKTEVTETPAIAEGNTVTEQAVEVAGQATEQGKVIAEQAVEVAGQATEQATIIAAQVSEQAKIAAATAAPVVSEVIAKVANATGLSAAPIERPASPVPEVVKQSITEAGAPAEAAAYEDLVEAKKEVETELKQEVVEALPITEGPKEEAEPTPAPTPAPVALVNAAKIADQKAPIVTNGINTKTIMHHEITLNKPADIVPEPVKHSVAEAGVSAEAASEPKAIVRKEAVEEQLKENVRPSAPIPQTNGASGAKTSIETPRKSTEAATSSSSKKSKRRSFFGAILSKLHFGKS